MSSQVLMRRQILLAVMVRTDPVAHFDQVKPHTSDLVQAMEILQDGFAKVRYIARRARQDSSPRGKTPRLNSRGVSYQGYVIDKRWK